MSQSSAAERARLGPTEKVALRKAGLSRAEPARRADGGGHPGRTRLPDPRCVPGVPVSAGDLESRGIEDELGPAGTSGSFPLRSFHLLFT